MIGGRIFTKTLPQSSRKKKLEEASFVARNTGPPGRSQYVGGEGTSRNGRIQGRTRESNDVRERRDEASPRIFSGDTLPQENGHRYLALGAAFAALTVGSAGAAFLGMSLLASDPVVIPSEREIVASAMSGQPAADTPAVAESSISEAFAAAAAAAPAAEAAAADSPPAAQPAADDVVVALETGDARFARDTPRARMLEGLDQESSPVRAFGNMTTPLKKIVEDAGAQAEPDRQETAAVPVAPEQPQISGGAPVGGAVMKADANIRSRPQKGAKVIGTVPDGTQVELVSCDGWCEIVVRGKRGFVWGEFVQRSKMAAKPVAASVESEKPDVVPAAKTMPQTDTNRGR
jgi:uncharacterized protein YgiM (DUF1202 family)